MLTETHTFTTIEHFINKMKSKNEIVGILEYGSRTLHMMEPGGDYDLTLVFKEKPSVNVNGIHFHISGIPIDCMFCSIADFMNDIPENPMLRAHLNCRILHDVDTITSQLMNRIKKKWMVVTPISDSSVNFYRFFFKHTLDKLKYRLFEDELFSYYSLSLATNMIIECMTELKNLEPGKPREVFAYIQKNEPALYDCLKILYRSKDLSTLYDALYKAVEYVLIDKNGIWKDSEYLFHINNHGISEIEEQRHFITYLFG